MVRSGGGIIIVGACSGGADAETRSVQSKAAVAATMARRRRAWARGAAEVFLWTFIIFSSLMDLSVRAQITRPRGRSPDFHIGFFKMRFMKT